jgi:hypothetical protein
MNIFSYKYEILFPIMDYLNKDLYMYFFNNIYIVLYDESDLLDDFYSDIFD